MAGQGAMITRGQALACQRSIERGPGKPSGGKDPNVDKYGNGMGVGVPTNLAGGK